MKKTIVTTGIAMLIAIAMQAQNTNLAFLPGNLAVLRGGDGTTNFTFKARRFPAFIDEFNPSTPNQAAPMLSVELPTNGDNSIWFNLHAGSEGQGLTRSLDRQFLAVTGYHGDLTNVTATPSSATDCTRGFGVMDAFTNFNVPYQSQDWFGIQPGITQNNPRGIATDGTNSFWGCGTVAGTQSGGYVESGTMFWNPTVPNVPLVVQNQVSSAYFLKIINGTLYMLCQQGSGGSLNNGIFDFVDINNNPDPLPFAPGQEQVQVYTNLVLDFGTDPYNGKALANVLTFDMNDSNTIAYAADNDYGIAKYVNNDGVWSMAYMFTATNLGTLSQPTGNQGIFGIAVDFSGTNPVIYATTMESADSSGDICSNRLISIVDTNNPGTNMVATTLAVANGPYEGFRGLAFTPDLRPGITSQPQDIDTTTNVPSSFTVGVQSVYSVGYQWQRDGINVTNSSNISGANSSQLSFAHSDLTNNGDYTVVVTNAYGAITSSVVTMTVSAVLVPPSYTVPVMKLTNYVGDDVNISATQLGGTPPFTFQWYDGTTALSDGPDANGSGYIGSQSDDTLAITNVQVADSGNYYIAVTNGAGGIDVEVASLTVKVRPPTIPSGGQPVATATLAGQSASLSISSIVGTPPLTYQWYQGNTNPVTALSDSGDFSGTATSTLTVSPAEPGDSTNYFCVVANSGGSTTSQVASVTVVVGPAPSVVGYSNQVYIQNFDSLPDPGLTTVNTSGGGGPVTIGAITYDPNNPFDFAFPVYFPNQPLDGLGLSSTMSGWYGECDAGAGQLGASCGDQTTGGIISFGLTNSVMLSQNRALGLIATSTSGATHFGLKLINDTGVNLNYINVQFTGEYWKGGGTSASKFKYMTFSYLVDPAGAAAPFSLDEINNSLADNLVGGLSFSFPGEAVQQFDGTSPQYQTNVAASNLQLSSPWTPGSALWLMWSITNSAGSGQGYGIDNLSFSASAVPTYSVTALQGIAYALNGANAGMTFSFTNTPGVASSFTVWSSTNVALPFSQWKDLGNPTESSPGVYSYTDPSAATNHAEFYRVTSP